MTGNKNNLLRIGVFYDGQYFFHVSNYYKFQHTRKARISIDGLHEFIRNQVSTDCGTDLRLCQIVDSHYFRGRLLAQDASDGMLFNERMFDEVLMNENVITHYLPLKQTVSGTIQEKGIDVWLALEAYELAIYKRFDILVLIASDGDYVPLVRKLNTLGTRVMLLSWDFTFTDENGIERTTRTSQKLLEEVSYPLSMHTIIDDRARGQEPIIKQLFTTAKDSQNRIQNKSESTDRESKEPTRSNKDIHESTIMSLLEDKAIGFISAPPNNIFFHYSNLVDCDYNDLSVGQKVSYTVKKSDNPKNEYVADCIWTK